MATNADQWKRRQLIRISVSIIVTTYNKHDYQHYHHHHHHHHHHWSPLPSPLPSLSPPLTIHVKAEPPSAPDIYYNTQQRSVNNAWNSATHHRWRTRLTSGYGWSGYWFPVCTTTTGTTAKSSAPPSSSPTEHRSCSDRPDCDSCESRKVRNDLTHEAGEPV